MPCFHPLAAWQSFEGDIAFYKRRAGKLLIKPKRRPANYRRDIQLPCGRCIGCRLDRSRQWATRCLHESQLHESNCFLTLTLKPIHDYLPGVRGTQDPTCPHEDVWTIGKSARELTTIAPEPATQAAGKIAHVDNSRLGPHSAPASLGREDRSLLLAQDPDAGLSIKTHQKFMKRLRKEIGAVRFYMCGEYGEKLDRPHYHYLIFGYDFPDKVYYKTSKSGEKLYRSATLEKLWPYGHAWIGQVTYESCAYVASYVMKKITGEKALEHYRRQDEGGNDYWLQPEFNLMSRNPGIASEWWRQFNNDVTVNDAIVHPGGFMAKPPRYYDKLLEIMDPSMYEKLKAAREARGRELAKDNTPERLATKEQVAQARLNLKTRQLETE